jgi:hypothetical protein
MRTSLTVFFTACSSLASHTNVRGLALQLKCRKVSFPDITNMQAASLRSLRCSPQLFANALQFLRISADNCDARAERHQLMRGACARCYNTTIEEGHDAKCYNNTIEESSRTSTDA